MGDTLGTGTRALDSPPVRGTWRMLHTPDDVLALMDSSAEGVVAGVADAGATFLAPIFDELTAVVCLSGTPQSHIGIVSREYQVPVHHEHRIPGRRAGGRDRGRGRLLGRDRHRLDALSRLTCRHVTHRIATGSTGRCSTTETSRGR